MSSDVQTPPASPPKSDIRPPAPPKRSPLIYVVLLAIVAGGGGWWFTHREPPQKQRYRTVAAEKRTVIRRIEASGHLIVSHRIEVPSLLQGILVQIAAHPGDEVKAGTVLARLTPPPSNSTEGVAQAQAVAALGNVARAEVEAQAARDAYDRAAKLSAQGLMGTGALAEAKAKVQGAQAALKAAQGQVHAANEQIRVAESMSALTVLKAPQDGVVIEAKGDQGELVGPSFGPLFVLADTLDKLQLSAEVSELDVAALTPKQPADVTVDALPGETFPAAVVNVGLTPARNGSLVTFPVTFELDNPGHRLKTGFSATAHVEADRAVDAVAVPEAALRFVAPDAPTADDRSRVFVLNAEGDPVAVAVKAALSDGAFTEVKPVEGSAPLKAGDNVIIGLSSGNDKGGPGGLNLSGKKP